MIDLESYLIPAMESDTTISSISSIIKKYPIKYPKELNKYQFDDKGNFDNSVKTAIEEFFYSKWEKRFNDILSEALSLPAYKEKIKSYCEKTGYSIKDFELELYDIYFRYYKDEPKSTQMYLNISFRNMDRYDAPGFPQLMGPILSQIVKYDIGNKWVVSKEEYPTDFSIYRPLNSSEMKVLQQLQDTIDEKKRIAKEKASASKKLRDQKNKERVDQEISKDSKRFYDQALKAQAMEIVKHFTFKQKWYYVNTNDIDLQQAKESCEDLASKKLKPNEKIFKFDYAHPNTFDIYGKPINNPLVCYAISSEDSNYKKLDRIYYVAYKRVVSMNYESYMAKK